MALTPEDEAQLRGYLRDARDALHRLNTGRQKVMVRADSGEAVQYAPSDEHKLRGYIMELETKLGIRSGRGPIELAV